MRYLSILLFLSVIYAISSENHDSIAAENVHKGEGKTVELIREKREKEGGGEIGKNIGENIGKMTEDITKSIKPVAKSVSKSVGPATKGLGDSLKNLSPKS
uniref:Uncharacterized protein n=1 Tax=Panagrolaimus davidi TaxID=227884 RepID=A0A914PMB2_9BILA